MKKPLLYSAIVIAVLTVSACDSEVKNTPETSTSGAPEQNLSMTELDAPTEKATLMKMRGTITYQDFEGGFFSFIAEDGSKFTPQMLAPEHRKDGLVVQITGEVVTDMMTTTQFGQLLKVHDITVIDASKTRPPKDTSL
jgi:hypothetical protein